MQKRKLVQHLQKKAKRDLTNQINLATDIDYASKTYKTDIGGRHRRKRETEILVMTRNKNFRVHPASQGGS